MTAIFEALSDPTRQRIMALLLDGERPVGDLVDALGVAQPSVSKHLARLKAAGLVDLRADAQRRVYRLTPEPLKAVGAWLLPYLEAPTADTAAATVELVRRQVGPQGWTLAFEAMLPATADAVWTALTNPDRLHAWLGSASVEPLAGGLFRFQFAGAKMVMRGKITTWAPKRKLECRWRINPKQDGPNTRAWFEIADHADGVRLTLSQDGLPTDLVAEVASLWHSHLERLAPALQGSAPPMAAKRIDSLRARYAEPSDLVA